MTLSWLHRLLKRKSRPVSRTAHKPFGRDRFVPNIEALGDRIVPSTFHVTTLADSGAGSLRAAVAQANALPGADTIDFQPGLTGTIALTGGQLDLTDDLTITGPGADTLTVSGSNISRVFTVGAGKTVLISGLTIARGNAGSGGGGGILNSGGTLTVRDSTFTGNAAVTGGGIDSANGRLTVSGSTFTRNAATGPFGSGGGIAKVFGTAAVSGSTFTGNSAGLVGGGIESFRGALTVSDSTFTGNAAVTGGGID